MDLSHPTSKDKDAARVGHPASQEGEAPWGLAVMAEEAAAGVVAAPGVVAAAAAVELGRLGGLGGVVGGMGTPRIVTAAEGVEAAGTLRFGGRLGEAAAG